MAPKPMYLCIRNYQEGKYSLSDKTTIYEYNQHINHKWLHGDIININTYEVINREAKDHKSIVGIIDFLNRVRIGITPRGVPMYNFHPYDPAYPTMIVSSKLKPSQNMVAIACLEHWQDKYPRAGIQHIFGPVGDQVAETAALRMGISTPRRPLEYGEEDDVVANTRLHDCSNWDIVFNIDPPGCQDVDDVMGWRRTNTGYDFFIGIVDITSWVPEDSWMDQEAQQAAQTLYIDGKAVEHMFPSYLSTQKASLRADGVKRPVIARLYRIQNNHITFDHWALLNVGVNTAYTYDSVLENPDIVETLPHLLCIVTGKPHTTDPHEWVEQAMILYNNEVAKILKNRCGGILRRHAGTTQQIYKAVAEKTNIKELAFLGASAGQYVSATSTDTYHAGLALDTYCHASSPLRRYADVVNHRWLKHFVFGFQIPYVTTMIEHLNHRNQAMKQFERLMWFLQCLNPDGSITTVDGIVLTYDNDKKSAKVYVPDWKRTVRAGHTTKMAYEPGTQVTIRAYSNLKATSIQQRVICSMN